MLMSPSAARVGPPGRSLRPRTTRLSGIRTCSVERHVREDARGAPARRGAGGRRRRRAPDCALTGADQGLARRLLCAAGALGGALGGDDLRQRLDAVRVVEELQDPVDLEPAGRDPHVPFELRPRQLAGHLQTRADAHVAKLVVDDLEVLRLEREVHGADLPLVHGELAGDGELLAVLVEDLEPADAHDVGLEVDAGVEAGVRGPESRHREGAVPDVDETDEVRVAAGAGDAHVSLERAADLGDGGREPLNDAEVERRRLHPDVDRILRRSGDVHRPSRASKTLIGTVPRAVIDTPGDCCSVASSVMRLSA